MTDPDEPEEEDFMPDDDADLLPSETPTVDASSVKQLRKSKRNAVTKEQESVAFWKMVLSTDVGCREIWGILEAAHTFAPVFANGPVGFPDPLATWFQAGQQDLGQRLWKTLLLKDRDGVMEMMRQNDPQLRNVLKTK